MNSIADSAYQMPNVYGPRNLIGVRSGNAVATTIGTGIIDANAVSLTRVGLAMLWAGRKKVRIGLALSYFLDLWAA